MSDAPVKGESLEEWLNQFEMMDVITALPEIMELWEANTDTQTLTEKTGKRSRGECGALYTKGA